MSSQSSVTVAAAIISKDEGSAPLALCVLHAMRDKRFVEMINTLVELNPVHWSEVTKTAKALQDSE